MMAILLFITSLQVYHVPPPVSLQSLRDMRRLDFDPGWRAGSFRCHFVDVVSSTNFLTSCMRQTGVLYWAIFRGPRDNWISLQLIQDDKWMKGSTNADVVSKQAHPKLSEQHYWMIEKNDSLPITHCPWHLDIKQLWPGVSSKGRILQYELVTSPTVQKPYYEAVVCSMPNIRCKANTVDLLQEQLLKRYADYLETLLADSIPVRNFLDENHHPRFWVPRASVNSEYAR